MALLPLLHQGVLFSKTCATPELEGNPETIQMNELIFLFEKRRSRESNCLAEVNGGVKSCRGLEFQSSVLSVTFQLFLENSRAFDCEEMLLHQLYLEEQHYTVGNNY